MPFLSSPDGSWPDAYASVQADLNAALAQWEPQIEHIGSTSVPGLHAKPLIDVVVGVDAEAVDVPELRAAIEQLGFRQASRQPSLGRRIFIRRTTVPAVNVHLVPHGGAAWTQLRLTRDLLREDPEVASSYVAMKQAADAESAGDYRKYRARKVAWFEQMGPRLEDLHRSRSGGGGELQLAAFNEGMSYSPGGSWDPAGPPVNGYLVSLDGSPGTQDNPIIGDGVQIEPNGDMFELNATDGGLVQEYVDANGNYRVDPVNSPSPSPG